MIYSKLRISSRLILLGLCTAFLHLHATAQQKTARYDLVLKSNKTTTSVLPAVRNSKLKAKFENEIHVKTREYTAKKMFETPTLAIANRPSRSIHNITSPGDTLFFEDFQSSVWPASMPRVNRDGKVVDAALAVLNFGTNAWIASPQSAGPGNTASLSTSYYAPVSQADDWMITPAVTITANNLLRWKARSIDPNPAFHDGYEVRICTNCPATFTNANVLTSFSTVLFSIDAELRGNAAIFEYQQRQLDLATYVGQTVRIAFRNNSDDKFLLSLDDIFIGKELAIDAQLTGLTALFSNQCTLGANESVKVKVSNKGSLPIASAPITVKVNGVQEGLGTITDLAPDETDSLTISGLDLSAIGAYEIEASVNVIDDGNAGNNTAAGTTQKVAPISLATTYQQSFETGDNLDNWIILDNNSDGASWVNFQTPQSGAEGTTGYMGYASLNPIPSDGDDWMITSCFTAEANVKYQFSFYERANGAINHTISLMAGTGQNPTDLTKTLYSGTDFIDDFDNWYQISDTFSLPATGIYYFGAHATSPAGTGRFRLDELKFRVSPAKDAKMEGVLFPTAAAYLCGSSSQQLAYIIKNDGSDVLTNIPVTLSLTGAATQTITMTVPTLAPGQTDTILFTGSVDISNPGNYTASIYSSYVGDGDISNDTTEISFNIASSISYPVEDDFEALLGQFDLPEGWWSDQFGSFAGFGIDGSIGLIGFRGSATGLDGDGVNPKVPGDTPAICDAAITPEYLYPSCQAGTARNSCSWTQCRDDDVDFTLALVRHIETRLCIDTAHVYATGGSNGGMFVWELGQNPLSAPTFRAIASVIGLPHRAYLGRPGKQERMPAILITGATAITRSWAAAARCGTAGKEVAFRRADSPADCRTYCPATESRWPAVLDCRAKMHHDYGLPWSWKLILDFFDHS